MKRTACFLCLFTACLCAQAQIDLCDRNWDTLFIEDFSGNRYWSGLWEDKSNNPDHVPLWICFADEYWGSGVTTAEKDHQAFQRGNAVFGSDSTMRLVGEFRSQDSLRCGIDYQHAPWTKYCHYCDTIDTLQHTSVHYYSGMLQTIEPVGYGYYEIKSKMPLHDGACSAFWLWSNLGHTYNEIDVFEHNKHLSSNNMERKVSCGIWYNAYGPNLIPDPDTGIPGAQSYDRKFPVLPMESRPLDSYHTFGCLWMPERVAFYIDGCLVNECVDRSHVPPHPMWIKITHTEDDAAQTNGVWWEGNDEMTIKYVKAFRLKSDCSADDTIRSVSEFNSFDYGVKHSITMGSLTGTLGIPQGNYFVMRAVNSIVIDGGFEVSPGTCMTLMTQDCPECSMEGVVLPPHNCGMDNEYEYEP